MPPKHVFTKDDVIDAAIQVIREKGKENLSARAIAKKLNSSTMPIYSLVSSMKELRGEVDQKITELFLRYTLEPRTGRFLFDNALGYIQFAKDEKELFKMMFINDDEGALADYNANKDTVTALFIERLQAEAEFQGFSEPQLRSIFHHVGIVIYGIACSIVSERIEDNSEEHLVALLNDVIAFFIQRETGRQ